MNRNKLRTIIFGSVLAGSLALPAASALARVDWRDLENDRARLRTDYEELAQARRQREWDMYHHATGYQLRMDDQAIQNKLDDIRRDREILAQDRFDYDNFS